MIQHTKPRLLMVYSGRKLPFRIRRMPNISRVQGRQEGFTLVELTLSTAFIGFILIFILATIVQVMSNYNKGLAIKQINQSARTVVEEFSRLASGTKGSTINTAYISNGRVCLGGVSYAWNIKGGNANKYTDGSTFAMVRVNDNAGALCSASLPSITKANATDVLSDQIWVQSLSVALSSDQQLVDIAISLSTSAPNQPTGTDPILGTICQGDRDSQFCAIATFKTTVNTSDGGG